jgi:hypothetical protein
MTAPVYVVSHLLGGLGNQLFQYAAGRALADRLGASLVLDATAFRTGYCQRPFELDRYPIQATVALRGFRKGPREGVVPLPDSAAPAERALRLVRRVVAGEGNRSFRRPRLEVLIQEGFDYNARFERLTGSTYLAGYWQSYRYFEPAAETIRRELRRPAPPPGLNRDWLSRIGEANAVCVHVRRGDYLLARELRVHGLCSPAYYEKAMGRIAERLRDAEFFLFSDDHQWCRENFRGPGIHLVDANGPDAAVEDLRLMAACRHHVIANSSLSWWAAWLADHPDQTVIAPDPWFTHLSSTPDLLPKHWQTLPRL